MNRLFKKTLSLMLVIVMTVSLGVSAAAADQTGAAQAEGPLGIVSAMSVELNALVEATKISKTEEIAGNTFYEGVLNGVDVVLVKAGIGKVLAVASGKGGVGKSMTSALLACAMARRGYHCGILDADITGPSIPKLFGIHGRAMADEKGCWPIQSRMGIDVMSINLLVENEEDPVVWRGPVIAGAVKQFWTDVVWKDVDFLFVDMPPGTGDVPLTVFQSLPVDGIVVVASPQELVSMIVAKAVNMAEMMKVPMLGIVENMSYIVCPDCGKHINVFGNSHVDEVAAKHHLPVLAKCPIDPQLAACSDAGMIEAYPGQYLEGAADACEKLLKK